MDKTTLRQYALTGARNRLEQLRQEQASLLKLFPELTRTPINGRAQASPPRRGRKKMSASERKAVSERMRKYWAARRKAAK